MNNARMAIEFYDKGNEQLAVKNYRKAIQFFSEAVEAYPLDAAFFIGRALAYAYNKDFESSVKDIGEALRLSPKNPYIYMDIAKIYIQMDEIDKAKKSLEKALKMPPDPAQYFPDGFYVSEDTRRRILEKARIEKDEQVKNFLDKITEAE